MSIVDDIRVIQMSDKAMKSSDAPFERKEDKISFRAWPDVVDGLEEAGGRYKSKWGCESDYNQSALINTAVLDYLLYLGVIDYDRFLTNKFNRRKYNNASSDLLGIKETCPGWGIVPETIILEELTDRLTHVLKEMIEMGSQLDVARLRLERIEERLKAALQILVAIKHSP